MSLCGTSASGDAALEAIDQAIIDCGQYVSAYANGKSNSGWGWCAKAVETARALAEARAAVVMSFPVLLGNAPAAAPEPECPLCGEPESEKARCHRGACPYEEMGQ